MTRTVHDNIGGVDSAVRSLLGVMLIAGAALIWGLAGADYALVGFMLLPPAAYLFLTAVVHVDLLYAMLGFDTVPGHVHHVAMTRPRI